MGCGWGKIGIKSKLVFWQKLDKQLLKKLIAVSVAQVSWKTMWWVKYNVSELQRILDVSGANKLALSLRATDQINMNTQSGAISLYLSVKLLNQRNVSKGLVDREVASWSSFIGQAICHRISFWISSIQGVHMGTWKIGIRQHFPVVTSISISLVCSWRT